MSGFKSLLQRELDDDSSSDDDDYFIITAARIVQHFRVINEDLVVLSLAMLLFIEIEKAAIKGCFKIIRRIIRYMVHICSVEGWCSFTFN
jgi:hypothetical protein